MEGYIAEIRLFGGNFAPRGWQFCRGQIYAIAQNTALFALLGTTFGGNGQTTFALPNLIDRVAVGTGSSPALGNFSLGQVSGSSSFTLTASNLPAHTHAVGGFVSLPATTASGNTDSPVNAYPAGFSNTQMYATNPTSNSFMGGVQSAFSTTPIGSSQPVINIQPVLGYNFIICVEGIFPSRN